MLATELYQAEVLMITITKQTQT